MKKLKFLNKLKKNQKYKKTNYRNITKLSLLLSIKDFF